MNTLMPSSDLQPGRLIPHFVVTTREGGEARYTDVWQRRNLVLFALPRSLNERARTYLLELQRRVAAATTDDTIVIAGQPAAQSIPDSTLIICDRWGEIAHLEKLSGDVATWPSADEVLEWVQFIRMQCPECPPH